MVDEVNKVGKEKALNIKIGKRKLMITSRDKRHPDAELVINNKVIRW